MKRSEDGPHNRRPLGRLNCDLRRLTPAAGGRESEYKDLSDETHGNRIVARMVEEAIAGPGQRLMGRGFRAPGPPRVSVFDSYFSFLGGRLKRRLMPPPPRPPCASRRRSDV